MTTEKQDEEEDEDDNEKKSRGASKSLDLILKSRHGQPTRERLLLFSSTSTFAVVHDDSSSYSHLR